jgi:hypothetical protein
MVAEVAPEGAKQGGTLLVQICPTVVFPFGMPFTVQLTVVFELPVTAGVMARFSPVPTTALVGATVTRIPESIVTLAVALIELFAWLVAVTITIAGFGTVAGALYKPVVEIVPTVAFPPTILFTA